MALKRLTIGEMITTTKTWIDPRHRHHQLLQGIAEVSPFLPRITAAHKTLLDVQPLTDPQAAERARLVGELDTQHDDLVRSLHFLFQAKVYKTQNPAERAAWEALFMTFLPQGLSVVNRSPTDEAGQASLAMARLTTEDKNRLKSLTFDGETAWKLCESYGKVAEALGQAAKAQMTPGAGTGRAEAATARNQWIRIVNAILSTLEMVGPSAEIEREILAPLAELERRAARRRAAPELPDPTDPNPAAPIVSEPVT